MSPLVPELYRQTRRKEILDAALQCFIKKGFHKATMMDICRAAKLSPGAVYNYYKSKEEIISAIAERSQKQAVETMKSVGTPAGKDPLQETWRTFMSLLGVNEVVEGFVVDLELFSESRRQPQMAEVLRMYQIAIVKQLIDLVKRRQKEGTVAKGIDPKAAGQLLLSLFYGAIIQKLLFPEMDIEAYMAAGEMLVERGIYEDDSSNR